MNLENLAEFYKSFFEKAIEATEELLRALICDVQTAYEKIEVRCKNRHALVKHLPMKSQVNLRKPKFIQARSRL